MITFLRKHIGLKGTKYMCREGACGTCIVNYTKRHPVTKEENSFAVNSVGIFICISDKIIF